MIFETHAHYDDEVFNEDREQLLAGLPEKGMGKNIPGIGLHPHLEDNSVPQQQDIEEALALLIEEQP